VLKVYDLSLAVCAFWSVYKLNFIIDKEYFAESSDNILWQADLDLWLQFSFVVRVFLYGAHRRLLNLTLVPTLARACKKNSILYLIIKSIQK
jgi:hypothetical protein